MVRGQHNFEKKDVVGLVIGITALCLSGFTIILDHFWNPHILKATVTLIDESPAGSLAADILFLNPGGHYEAVRDATFMYSRSDGVDKHYSGGSVGPVLLRPGEMKILRLTGPSVEKVVRDGLLSVRYG